MTAVFFLHSLLIKSIPTHMQRCMTAICRFKWTAY